MKANVKKANLSSPKMGGNKCEGDRVDSVSKPWNVRKASLSDAKGTPDQLGNPKRGGFK
jgi:hypothetical protein